MGRHRHEAPPWVLLHGFLGAPASWDAVLSCVPSASARRAQCLTLPGHGQGPLARVPTRFVHAARSLWRQVRGRGPVLLGGYSLGGRLALAMALLRPERVAALVLVGAQLGIASSAARAARRARDRAWAQQLRQEGLAAFLASWRAQGIFATQNELASEVLARQTALTQTHDPHGLAHAVERLSPGHMPDYTRPIAALTCPVHWLAGARDTKYAREVQQGAAKCRNGSYALAPGVGHNVLLERPEAVAAALCDVAAR